MHGSAMTDNKAKRQFTRNAANTQPPAFSGSRMSLTNIAANQIITVEEGKGIRK